MRKLTAEWIRKGESDLRVAERLALAKPPEHDIVCFHCQQSAEKLLKALLIELGLAVPRTHNLLDLLGIVRPHVPTLQSLRRGLVFLTQFSVDTRYPGFHTRRRQSQASIRWANQVRNDIRKALGLRTRPLRWQ
jgi:HEPN domain-containing protein